jgi:DNA-binding transcriptional ArsR family regulator
MWNVNGQQNHGGITLDLHAKLFRGLADAARLAILLRLAAGPRSAGELAAECGLSPSNASNHLRCLLECGLVSLKPQGRRNVYRLTDPRVARLLDASRALLSSPSGALIKACCNYESVSRRALRSSSRSAGRLVAAPDPGDTRVSRGGNGRNSRRSRLGQ